MTETSGMLVSVASRCGEIGVSSDPLEDCRPDRHHLAIDLFEALRILALQQGCGQNLATVLGGGAVLHQGFAGQVGPRMSKEFRRRIFNSGAREKYVPVLKPLVLSLKGFIHERPNILEVVFSQRGKKFQGP